MSFPADLTFTHSLAKLVCHREVLSRDLLVEDRETRPARHGSHRRRNSSRPPSPSQQTPRPPNQQWPSSLRAPDRPPSPQSNPRDSFDSAPEQRNDFGARESVSEDELDRLRSAPPLQRSQTETLWSSTGVAPRNRFSTGFSEDELPPTTRPLLGSPSNSANSLGSPPVESEPLPTVERSGGSLKARRSNSIGERSSQAWAGYTL